jgi:hypothetical protein
MKHQVRVVDVIVAATEPAPSKWFVAPIPLRCSSHCAPTASRLGHEIPGSIDTGSLFENCTYTSMWSCRFDPTPGRSATGLYTERLEPCGTADAGELQQLWCVDRAAAEDHFAARTDRPPAAGLHVFDAYRAAALETDARDVRSRQHVRLLRCITGCR